MVLVVELTKLL